MATNKKAQPKKKKLTIKEKIAKENPMFRAFDENGNDESEEFESIEGVAEFMDDNNVDGTLYVYKLVPVGKVTRTTKIEKF